MQQSVVTVKDMVIEDTIEYNDETILVYRIEYPQFFSNFYILSLNDINNFVRRRALEYVNYVKTELYNMAVEQYKYNVENNFPVIPYGAYVNFQITYNSGCILSLYFDQYVFMGGAHGNTVRYAYTFDLKNGYKIRLEQLFGCYLNPKSFILSKVNEQISRQPELYFEDYAILAEETFDAKNFYCTPEGIVFFYMQYDIAPYSSGIREFLIPYDDCVLDPIHLCSHYS